MNSHNQMLQIQGLSHILPRILSHILSHIQFLSHTARWVWYQILLVCFDVQWNLLI